MEKLLVSDQSFARYLSVHPYTSHPWPWTALLWPGWCWPPLGAAQSSCSFCWRRQRRWGGATGDCLKILLIYLQQYPKVFLEIRKTSKPVAKVLW